jgi:hypothetical protein
VKTYRVRLERKQSWTYVVEAEDKDDAISKAESMSDDEPAHDDWYFSAEAQEQS